MIAMAHIYNWTVRRCFLSVDLEVRRTVRSYPADWESITLTRGG